MTRDFIEEDQTDFNQFIKNPAENKLIGFSNTSIVYWNIDELDNLSISKKIYLWESFDIKKVFNF